MALKNTRDGLTLLHLPEMAATRVAELLPPEREYTQDEITELALWLGDTWAAVLHMASLAWSHDGSQLAFASAMNGVSPDIYVYRPLDSSILWLTSAPTYALYPSWSPDDRYVLHDAANQVWDGYSGRGAWIAGVWLAPQDGAPPRLLFESRFGSQKGFENRHGWLSDSTYLASSESAWCGATDLRIVNIEDGDQSPIWQGSFFDAVADPQTSTVLILVPEETYPWTYEECAPHEGPGLYLLSLAHHTTRSLGIFNPSGRSDPTMQWSPEAGLFFAETDQGLLAITPSGDITHVHPDLGLPTVSQDGQWWAPPHASGESLWLGGPAVPPRPIFTGEVGATTWSPGDGALFFLGQLDRRFDTSTLYVARPPDFAADAVVEDLHTPADPRLQQLRWVIP